MVFNRRNALMLRVILGLVLACCLCNYALAKDSKAKPKPTLEEQFKQIDSNNDNQVTEEEYLAYVKKVADEETAKKIKSATKAFHAADKDKKGYLSLDEFKAMKTKNGGKKKAPAAKKAPADAKPAADTKPADTKAAGDAKPASTDKPEAEKKDGAK